MPSIANYRPKTVFDFSEHSREVSGMNTSSIDDLIRNHASLLAFLLKDEEYARIKLMITDMKTRESKIFVENTLYQTLLNALITSGHLIFQNDGEDSCWVSNPARPFDELMVGKEIL